jgi:hypothetical protein
VGTTSAAALLAAVTAPSATRVEAAPLRFGPGFVDGKGAPSKLLAIKVRNSLCGSVVISHLDEGKASRLARVSVRHDPDLLNFTECTEQIPEFVFGSGKGKVSYKKVLHLFSSQVRNIIHR